MRVNLDLITVGDIVGTNSIRFLSNANGLSIALTLLSSRNNGAPVVDSKGTFIGFVSEFDLLKAIESGQDPGALKAKDIMTKSLHAVSESTSIEDAVMRMEDMHLLSLPVVDSSGVVTQTITRHDLLRASLGVDLGIENV